MFEIDDYIARFSRYPVPVAREHWVREHENVSVHSRALKPTKLIDKRRPFEDDGIKEYRIDAYEPITADVFGRAINNLQRIMSGSQVSVEIDKDLREYLDRPGFDGFDFSTFINKRVIRRMIEDPNGVLLWWPTGKGVTLANDKVDVEPKLILSTQIKHFDANVFTYLSSEKSLVKVQEEGKTVERYEGKVFYIVTKSSYYKYSQFGEKSKDRFELELHYDHKLDALPLVVLGGEEAEEIKKNGDSLVYLKSYFHAAVPFANEAIRQFSDHQGIMVTSAFPIREIEEIPCPEDGCNNGIRSIVDEVNGSETVNQKECSTCKGKGYIVPMSPYGVLTRKKGSGIMEKDKDSSAPMMRYISPPVEIVRYSGEHWMELLKKAEKALNLLFIEEAQSGKAKEIDREDKVAQLDKIGANVFKNIVYNSIRLIDKLRNLGAGKGKSISITLPSTFKTKTEHELIEEMATLRDKNAPSFLLAQATIDYVKKRYSGNRSIQRAIDFLAQYDPIFYLTQAEKDGLLASTVITEEQHGKSLYSFSVVTSVASEMGEEFLTESFETIQKKVDAILVPMIQTSRPPIEPGT